MVSYKHFTFLYKQVTNSRFLPSQAERGLASATGSQIFDNHGIALQRPHVNHSVRWHGTTAHKWHLILRVHMNLKYTFS